MDGLVGPLTWFALHPAFLDPSSDLTQFDIDGDGRIGPYEVWAMGDSNSPECDVPPDDACPTTTADL